jgi:hypothetical protein
VTPCGLVWRRERFWGMWRLHFEIPQSGSSTFLRNTGIYYHLPTHKDSCLNTVSLMHKLIVTHKCIIFPYIFRSKLTTATIKNTYILYIWECTSIFIAKKVNQEPTQSYFPFVVRVCVCVCVCVCVGGGVEGAGIVKQCLQYLEQGCMNVARQTAVVTKFCKAVPRYGTSFESPLWHLELWGNS